MRRNYKRCVTIHYFSTHLSSLTMLRSNTVLLLARVLSLAFIGKDGYDFIESCKSGARPIKAHDDAHDDEKLSRTLSQSHTAQTTQWRVCKGLCGLWACTPACELSSTVLLDLSPSKSLLTLKPYYVVLNMPCTVLRRSHWSHIFMWPVPRDAPPGRV